MYSKEILNYLDTMRFLEDDTQDVVYIGDIETQKVYYTSRFAEVYGLPPVKEGEGYSFEVLKTFMSKNESEMVDIELATLEEGIGKAYTREYSLLGEDGVRRFVSSRTRIQADDTGKPKWLIGKLSTIENPEKIDYLTGLRNLKSLMEDFPKSISTGRFGYLVIFGIDNLKDINTQHGREQGNETIKKVAQELHAFGQTWSKVYRLDSDKFALIMAGASQAEVQKLYDVIQAAVVDFCTVSSGAAAYSAESISEAVYQYAENALYSAKANGKNMQVFFSEEVHEKHMKFIELQEELRNSVHNGFTGFSVCYQPQIDAATYKLHGAEALLSFNSSVRGKIVADEFIAVLEHTKLIVEVGEWVLKQALRQCKIWRESRPGFHISVNVSYIQLKEEGFEDRVIELVQEAGLPGKALTLEVTESIRLQDYQYFNKIFYKLKKHGIQIAIDDFGTGYSSLSYLKGLSIDEIKIDRCFISHVQHSAYNYRLLSNMIELAHSVNIRVCCEGVEMEGELIAIQKLNPDLIQGYLFARSYTVEQFEEVYLNPGSPAYQERLFKELYFRELDLTDDEGLERIRQEKIGAIVDGMEEMIYVRDLKDYSLLYLNAAGRAASGVYDYKGKKCYEVLQGKDSPCEFCQNYQRENNDYNVWEIESSHMNKHFLLKDKNIAWNGGIARLAVAIDVTEKEIMSKQVQEKLDFEQNIVACTTMLLEEGDRKKAIDNVLQSIGEFYDADRAYLFELQDNALFWDNTHEWCSDGVIPQIDNLQDVPIETTERWRSLFARGESIVIEDLETIKEISPLEYSILKMQEVTHLIVSPVWKNKEAIGFIGVDNPRKHKTHCGQVQTMALFVSDRLQKDETKQRLNELLNLQYEDILKTTSLGLWFIRIDEKNQKQEMFADRTMLRILGAKEGLTPEECYTHWYNRIHNGYYHYVRYGVENMIETCRTVELSYTWNHPEKGLVSVRCLGKRVADSDGMVCLAGYHREINEIDQPKYLPDETSVIFEYDAEKHNIYFHNARGTLAGVSEKEQNFPGCWLEQEMIHPRFTEQFCRLFEDVKVKDELEGQEFLLKTKAGSYEWFRVRTRRLREGEEETSTILVLIDPAKQARATELDYMRQSQFYHAILAEKEAYAEIDVESGRIISAGGCWTGYKEESDKKELDFVELFIKHGREFLHEDDQSKFEEFMSIAYLQRLLRIGQHTVKLEVRRRFGNDMHWAELTGHVFQDQKVGSVHALLYMKDIDAQKREELEREMEATRDPLTGVFNRRKFEKEVKKHMADLEESGTGALLMLDMDYFKNINDKYGHSEGDKVLKHLADVLMQTFRRRDLVGRLGGDEFVVFLRNVTNKDILDRRLEEMNKALGELKGHKITCSVGITFAHSDTFSYAQCLEEADEALYRSKQNGRNRHTYYDDL